MGDLIDGESVEMKGSGAKPYVLKNVGGVYSCTCPAWRNQSVAIERRTCKHLRKLRGDAAEEARIGQDLPAQARPRRRGRRGAEKAGPPLLLAERWDNAQDLAGWWLSEKLDGVRAYWDGKSLISRLGNRFHAPTGSSRACPTSRSTASCGSAARRSSARSASSAARTRPTCGSRSATSCSTPRVLTTRSRAGWPPSAPTSSATGRRTSTAHEHAICTGLDHLRAELARIEALGGEGLMLRQPESRYEVGRSLTLLKVKSFHDAEARVLEHLKGAGRHKGRLGALLVELADGTQFSVGTGFSDAEREAPPPIGSVITFRYQELSDGGVPRFPSYVGVRTDAACPTCTDHRLPRRPRRSRPRR